MTPRQYKTYSGTYSVILAKSNDEYINDNKTLNLNLQCFDVYIDFTGNSAFVKQNFKNLQ